MYKIINHPGNLKFIEFYNQNNFHVILSNYGASIYQIDTPDRRGMLESVTLSPLMVKYYHNSKYYGLTVGRVAGRIKDATFKIGHDTFKMNPNEKGNLLHSGENSFAYKTFDFDIDNNEDVTNVTFKLKVKDMEDGFPGDLDLRVIYHLFKEEDALEVEYLAISSKDTILNITNHSYFNLSGNLKNTIENEMLSINKEYVGVMDDELLLKEFIKVPKLFDYRNETMISKNLFDPSIRQSPIGGYDHIFSGREPLHITLSDEKSGRKLTIDSDYRDVVIYTNNTEAGNVFPNAVMDKPFLGIAIEPCRYSDILKKNGFLLQANALYHHKIKYAFSIEEEE